MITRFLLGTTLLAAVSLSAPAFAQSAINNNQPIRGELHTRAANVQNMLKASYEAGNLTSTELAEMQRDLDGILVKEDRLNTSSTGLTDSGAESISKALDLFEGKLARHANKTGKISDADPTTRKQAARDVNDKLAAPVLVPIGKEITGNQSSVVQPTPVVVPTAEVVAVPVPVVVPAPDAVIVPVAPASGTVIVSP
ncbi:MAG: hypothetical protein WCT03_22765 [Candidatus Obscuribacterales bacterium]|jgi:hypothetical protein